MADKKISEFPSGVPSNQGVMLQYELASERGGANYKLSLQDVMNLIGPNASTSPYSPYTFPQFAATTATISTLNVAGASTFGNAVNSGGGTGTLGQVLSSTGSSSAPKWIDNFPVGGIIMWSGTVATIPTGWVLCDGTNNTPDLRNRFIIGASTDTATTPVKPATNVTGGLTSTGGSKDAVVVTHSHSITDPGHKHTYQTLNFSVDAGEPLPQTNNDMYWQTKDTSSAYTGITINSTGESGLNQNLPPYIALAYIMKTAYT